VPGLRWLDTAAAVPLASKQPPTFRRAVMIAFWDDEAAAAAFARDHPLGQRFAENGFHAVVRPVRAYGTWPGLPDDVPRARTSSHEGPVLVTTLGKLRMSQVVRFLRASRPAERAALAAEGFVWGTAATRPAGRRPPLMATISLWESADAAAAYAYSDPAGGHPRAVAQQRSKDFHHESAFIRHVPLTMTGSVRGMPSITT
ncbi:MAG TPA: spheroidene monooxygenase, partial [Acidimicrobiia bacterium]|nr:spheroidene monooxygenase [Acidimicrobiia bacterium]